MLKRYRVTTECEAIFLHKNVDQKEVAKFLLGITHSFNDKGLVIVTPGGDDLIPFDKVYLLFDAGTNQLLSIEKVKFESQATEIIELSDNLEGWEEGHDQQCH